MNSSVISTILLVLLITFSLPSRSASQSVYVATGQGETNEIALSNALRNAVEHCVGRLVTAETVASNYRMISDRIISRANGLVRQHTVLQQNQLSTGIWEVTVEASITPVIDSLLADDVAVAILYEAVNRPRFFVLLDETGTRLEGATSAENELIRLFTEKGISVVEGRMLARTQSHSNYANLNATDLDLIYDLAERSEAEVLILGNARAEEVTSVNIGPLKSVNATIHARVIRADNGDIVAAADATGREPSATVIDAAARSYREAAELLGNQLLRAVFEEWSRSQVEMRNYDIEITAIQFSETEELMQLLRSFEGIGEIQFRQFENDRLALTVPYRGTCDGLGRLLQGTMIGGKVVAVLRVESNSMAVELQNP